MNFPKLSKKYLTNSIITVYIKISHEGKAPPEGAAISGFFIEQDEDGKEKKIYRCDRRSGRWDR